MVQEKLHLFRMEAGTNLIGGQPFSLGNFRRSKKEVCNKHGILLGIGC